jgi:hypothetical protein
MERRSPGIRKRIIAAWVLSIIAVALLTFFGQRFPELNSRFENVFENASKQYELLSRMRINLLTSVEKEKSAVMALTDEDSQNFADQSMRASAAVDRDLRKLEVLVEKSGLESEMKMLAEFNRTWTAVKTIDKTILEYAVQNTNLKATGLSGTIGKELLDKIEQDLGRLGTKVSPPLRKSEITRLSCQAVNAALKIGMLQAPHISESSEEKMSAIEKDMQSEELRARTSLKTLDSMTGKKSRPFIRQAMINFDEFMRVNEEIIRLSRLNSNNKSMELSLGRKRMAAAECDNMLKAMQDKVKENKNEPTK